MAYLMFEKKLTVKIQIGCHKHIDSHFFGKI